MNNSRRLSYRLVALLTFALGIAAVWYMQQPSASLRRLDVLVPPAPMPLTHEQTAEMPNSCNDYVVSIEKDGSLKFADSENVGSVEETDKLITRLREIFQDRLKARAYKEGITERPDFAEMSEEDRVQRIHIIIKSPRSAAYEDVVRVVDAAKSGGASPVSLQIEDLPK